MFFAGVCPAQNGTPIEVGPRATFRIFPVSQPVIPNQWFFGFFIFFLGDQECVVLQGSALVDRAGTDLVGQAL
jgi:hypothetical protein